MQTFNSSLQFTPGHGLPFGQLIRSTALLPLSSGSGSESMPGVGAVAMFTSLLCLCVIVGHLLEEFQWINESVTAILFGLLTGTAVLIFSRGASSHILEFNEELFFIYLLPPIIFNAGFQVKKKQFFRNFLTIMAYGVVGVFISCGVISAGCSYLFGLIGLPPLGIKDYLALGTIFSATDSVCTLQVLNQEEQPLLYSLVFGEGVVNDAASVVLFRAVQKLNPDTTITLLTLGSILYDFLYLFLASTLLGIAVGLVSAYIIRVLYIGWHSTDRETALMVLMAYLSYVLSEIAELSGILTVFFCGIVMSHYTWHNVTESSRVTTKHAFATMSFIAETFIFIYVGMDTMKAEKWERFKVSQGILLFSILFFLTLLGRAAFVFPLSALLNVRRREERVITPRQQIVVWWSGLMRGAVSIALTFNAFPQSGKTEGDSTIVSTTVAFALFSTTFFGTLTRPLIAWLLPAPADEFNKLTRSDSLQSEVDTYMAFSGQTELQEPLINGRSRLDPLSEVMINSLEPELKIMTVSSLARAPSKIQALFRAKEKDVHAVWRHFDDKFMRPYFGGRGFVPYTPASPTVLDIEPHHEGLDASLLEGIEEIAERRALTPVRFDTARCVDEGLAESDPAWPEIDHHRKRRTSSMFGSGREEDP